MKLSNYQVAARATAVYPGRGEFGGLAYAALGLNGEAGECAEKIKKLWRDDGELNEETRLALIKEMGDVLWYLAALADEINVGLDYVAIKNLEKLKEREHRGVLAGSGDDR